ncbi:hypothetical protein [Bdellovibrio svalbardensis]|uniref:Uncharacterized protein n=1 Tax=Bdellovibrio svalbardensis TaxID=2972972 RepID=A0ABT6DRN1_9BACT|nr:hypothetical protein [Bdellovibrio svalbardensis]MDG0817818.1 hypothetical protein [Bdellovibrio svalbardensis]
MFHSNLFREFDLNLDRAQGRREPAQDMTGIWSQSTYKFLSTGKGQSQVVY